MVTQKKRTESIPLFASTKSERAEKYNTEMNSSQAVLLQTYPVEYRGIANSDKQADTHWSNGRKDKSRDRQILACWEWLFLCGC